MKLSRVHLPVSIGELNHTQTFLTERIYHESLKDKKMVQLQTYELADVDSSYEKSGIVWINLSQATAVEEVEKEVVE